LVERSLPNIRSLNTNTMKRLIEFLKEEKREKEAWKVSGIFKK